VTNSIHPLTRGALRPRPRQRGIVLIIALMVMVAMSLAAIALIRSVDTTTAVIGNLAFRQASILPANYAIEDAAAALFANANQNNAAWIPDIRVDTAAWNYYATHPPAAASAIPAGCAAANWDDKYGVPCPLQTQANVAVLALNHPPWTDAAGNTVTYLIERMCNPNAPVIPADFSAAGTWCDMMKPKQAPGATINDPMVALLLPQPFYRVTVRVDGPKNTVSFAQAILR
jgi:type IV pilus assembly protein PilX